SEVVELGCITSRPGASQQSIHADVKFASNARRIYTTFVALQDVPMEMGPTLIWKGSHTEFFCMFYKRWFKGPVDEYWAENEPVPMLMRAGDCVLMDTRVTHAGGANVSDQQRMLMHFSF
ncbi:hypothetical protein T492DRAFT_557816, partial [Pavlovales sp. CCMP2436]